MNLQQPSGEGRRKKVQNRTRSVFRSRSGEIAGIRQKLNVSQPVFAALLNVPLATARSWEQGKRKPSGAALRLLDLARQRPQILLAA